MQNVSKLDMFLSKWPIAVRLDPWAQNSCWPESNLTKAYKKVDMEINEINDALLDMLTT